VQATTRGPHEVDHLRRPCDGLQLLLDVEHPAQEVDPAHKEAEHLTLT